MAYCMWIVFLCRICLKDHCLKVPWPKGVWAKAWTPCPNLCHSRSFPRYAAFSVTSSLIEYYLIHIVTFLVSGGARWFLRCQKWSAQRMICDLLLWLRLMIEEEFALIGSEGSCILSRPGVANPRLFAWILKARINYHFQRKEDR